MCWEISLFDACNCAQTLLPAPLTLAQHSAMKKLQQFTPTNTNDKILWTVSSSGSFSVSSIYNILSQGGKLTSDISSIWRAKVTPTMKCFFFFLLHNRILTHDVMQRHNLHYTPGCVMCCNGQSETGLHLFFQCPCATHTWSAISTAAGYQTVKIADTILHTYNNSVPADKQRRKKWRSIFITVTWQLWKERNERTFRQHCTLFRQLRQGFCKRPTCALDTADDFNRLLRPLSMRIDRYSRCAVYASLLLKVLRIDGLIVLFDFSFNA